MAQGTGLALAIDTFELDQGRRIRTEAVGLPEKRHEDAIGHDQPIGTLGAVEDIVFEMEAQFPGNAVRLAQAADPDDIFLFDHTLEIWAPSWLSRSSMCS